VTAESNAAQLHFPFAALTFGFKHALGMLPTSLILREFGDGSVRLNYDVADTFSIRNFPLAFQLADLSRRPVVCFLATVDWDVRLSDSRNLAHNPCRINKPVSPSFWHW
jgi:hypothetical protein